MLITHAALALPAPDLHTVLHVVPQWPAPGRVWFLGRKACSRHLRYHNWSPVLLVGAEPGCMHGAALQRGRVCVDQHRGSDLVPLPAQPMAVPTKPVAFTSEQAVWVTEAACHRLP